MPAFLRKRERKSELEAPCQTIGEPHACIMHQASTQTVRGSIETFIDYMMWVTLYWIAYAYGLQVKCTSTFLICNAYLMFKSK